VRREGPRDVSVDVTVPAVASSVEPKADGSFRTLLPLREGVNAVDIEATTIDEEEVNVVLARRRLRVDRARPRSSGHGALDRATAWTVAREHLYLCGEAGGGCYSQPRCVRVTRTRVDCPSTVHWDDARIGRCGEVYSVERGPYRRVLFGTYACPNKPMPSGTARRFVRPEVHVARRRFVGGNDLIRTPYGVPQYDVFTNRLVR
jgi:hypothetical protein